MDENDMIMREKAVGVVESWIEYYEQILELADKEGPNAERIRTIIRTLRCVSEEIEEA